jgi:predicted ATPase
VELAKMGFPYASEVARQIIQEQVRTGGTALPWADRETYAHLMLERSIGSYMEHRAGPGPTFSDRGIPDTLAYARLIGLNETDTIETACCQYRYAPLVFVTPPWKEVYVTDSERKQDLAEAEHTFEQITKVYRQFDYDVLELPKLTPLARAQFILERLQLLG